MSFEINWDNLVEDQAINEGIREFLDDQLHKIELPLYISGLSVTNFNLGTIPPVISIIHIGNPFDEFYDENLNDLEQRLADLNLNRKESNYDDNSSDDEDYDNASTNLSTISEDSAGLRKSFTMEFPKLGSKSTSELHHLDPELKIKPSRNSLDSLSLMLGNNNLNFLHNHNLNNLGLGALNSPSINSTRADTPTRFLEHVRSSTMREGSNSLIRTKKLADEKDPNDLQLIVEIDYRGDLEINITVDLLVNYPSPKFISLPIKLHITDIVIHSIAVIAYLKHSVFISILCDINDQPSDYFTSSIQSHEAQNIGANSGGTFVDYINNQSSLERIDIIKKIKIESQIGGAELNILRNVGKVEKFLADRLRGLLRDEIAWPSWICLDMNEEDEEEDDDDDDDDDDEDNKEVQE